MPQEIRSPWLKNLKRIRPLNPLQMDGNCDVAVAGGGISGVATSYFLLRDTDLDVMLLEKDRIAQGATGHNGGQAVAGFEQSLEKLCQIFGEELVSDGLKAIEGAWDLLYSMISETGIDIDIQEVSASLAFSSLDDVVHILQERRLSERLGIAGGDIILEEDVAGKIPGEYRDLFVINRKDSLAEILHTKYGRYICLQKARIGLLNSALFCEEIVSWLLERYPDRFQVFENTEVQSIKTAGRPNFSGGGVILRTMRAGAEDRNVPADEQIEALEHRADHEDAPCSQHWASGHSVHAKYAVLCTNGYDNLTIEGIESPIMNSTRGIMGFMIGCLDAPKRDPMAVSYFDSRWHDPDDGYYYLSSRAYTDTDGLKRTLICVGGQDKNLNEEERRCYDFVAGKEEHYSLIESFYQNTIVGLPQCRDPDFTWNGLMGYTKNKVRLIGPDPAEPSLIYNLGCNGIGILPAIYGGKRVAQLLGGVKLAPSMFDPKGLLGYQELD